MKLHRHHKWAIAAAIGTAVVSVPVTSHIVNPAPVPATSNTTCHINGLLPDKACTPGAIDPQVTQANINSTICVSGYTKTVRPPVSYTNQLKITQMAQYGFSDTLANHEEDHLIALEIGGSGTDPKNLWPEPYPGAHQKDQVENLLHSRVCSGQMTLAAAQAAISTDWTAIK